jgi:hypothetical protein
LIQLPYKVKRVSLFLLLNLVVIPLFSQNIIKGKIVDRETGQPLPFVNIIYNDKGQGVTSDLDGAFEIRTTERLNELRTSYVGYLPEIVEVNPNRL